MRLQKRKELTKESILEIIDEYDILRMYWPSDKKLELNKAILSPFRGEKEKSFIVGTKYNNITYKDLGDSYYRGDIWKFVMQMESLATYHDVLLDIDKRFNLGLSGGNPIKGKPKVIDWEQPKLEFKTKPILIQATVTTKSDLGEKYLSEYHLTLKDMNLFKDTKVRFAKELFINKVRQSLGDFCLIYNLKNERGNWIKAYRPNGDKANKWRSNIPFVEMHGIDEILGCETVILTKSIKDSAFLTKYTGICTTAIQAEDITAISEENLSKLKSIPNLYIVLDSDKKGKSTSKELTNLLGCKHVNVPDKFLEFGVTDFADMGRYCGIDCVLEHFKNKKIL